MYIDSLMTETRNQSTLNIDSISTEDILHLINNEDKSVPYAVENVIPQIAKVVDIVVEAFKHGGRLIYMGAGTSGRIGILDASECPPTYGTPPELVQALIAGGHKAILKAVEGAEDNIELGVEDLKSIEFCNKDVLVGIAASGRTPYVLGAVEYAKNLGANTVGVDNNPDTELSKIVDISISAIVGPEAVTGSTRMKAGTSQKLILNMISTAAMIKYGKVYKNLMVDVQPTNNKLKSRCKSIVMQATGVSEEDAVKYLLQTDYNCKLSIFMILSSLNKKEAEEILNKNDGYIRKALDYYFNTKSNK